jgi:lipid A disaccharide synthetase
MRAIIIIIIKKKLIAFLPGSRDNEINKLFPYLEYLYEYLLVNNITAYKIFYSHIASFNGKTN